jgi:hypothetical protein
LFAIVSAALAWNLPPVMDEVDYLQAMSNWSTLGLPVFDHGLDDTARHVHPSRIGAMRLGGRGFAVYSDPDERGNDIAYLVRDDGELFSYGLWHPPLYVGIGALLARSGLRGALGMRVMNLALALAALVVAVLLAGRQEPANRLAGVGVALSAFACIPFLWGAGLLDVQSGLGPLVVLLWMAIASTAPERSRGGRSLAMTILLAVVLSSSLALGAACAAGLLLTRLLQWGAGSRDARSLAHAVLVIAAGSLVFVAAYGLAAIAFKLPWACTFQHNLQSAGSRGAQEFGSGSAWWVVRRAARMILELNPVVIAAVAIAAFALARRGVRPAMDHWLALPIVTLAILFGGFAVLGASAYGFPKYVISAGLLAALVSGASGASLSRRPSGALVAGAIAILAVGWGISSLAAEIGRHDRHPYVSDVVSMPAAANAVRDLPNSPDEALICDKDVAFLARRPFVEAFGPALEDPPRMEVVAKARRVWLLLGPQSWRETSPIAARSRAGFAKVWSRGTYELWVTNSAPNAPLQRR